MKDLLVKTRPVHSKDIVGNTQVIKNLKEKLTDHVGGILISGPIGVGKTLTVELIIKELSFEGIWYDASDLDSKTIESLDFISHGMSNKRRIFVIDNADGFPDSVTVILNKKLQITQHTVVIICNDLYPLKNIEKNCVLFKFIRPTKIQIKNFLFKWKIFKESSNHTKIEDLITETNNDIRFLLNTLSFKMTHSDKDKTINNIFDATSIMFDKDEPMDRKINAFYSDTFMIPPMIHDNYLIGHKRPLIDYSISADYIAEADIMNEAAGPNTWELNNYQANALIMATRGHKINYPQFSKLIGKDSTMRSRKKMLEWQSRLDRIDQIPYLLPILFKKIINKDWDSARDLMHEYDITRDILYDFLCKIWLGSPDAISISTKDKTAFTKFLNKPVVKPVVKPIVKPIGLDESTNITEYAQECLMHEFYKLTIREFLSYCRDQKTHLRSINEKNPSDTINNEYSKTKNQTI